MRIIELIINMLQDTLNVMGQPFQIWATFEPLVYGT